ncbi:MAG: hypothetical protein HYV09_33925 [Deltaproteobacteria bacterium]|nr:hypothetical protein [Deltaproteobacteria bacterium]
MRSALLFVLLVGCGGRVIDGAGSDWEGVGGIESKDDAAVDSRAAVDGGATIATDATTAVDATPVPTDTGPSPVTPGCGEAFWGGARPEIFKSYRFMTTASDCVDGMCAVGSSIEASCVMNAQVRDETRALTLSEPDCAWVKRMSTSTAMLNALKEPYACPSAPKGGTPDLLDIMTTERLYYSKYGSACAEEPLATQKKCMLQLVAKYWPGAKL